MPGRVWRRRSWDVAKCFMLRGLLLDPRRSPTHRLSDTRALSLLATAATMGGRVAQRCGCVHRVRACCASVLACGHTLRWRPARSTWHEHAQTASFTFKLACVVFLGGFLCATEFPDGLLEQTMQVSLWLQRGAIALLLMRGAMRAFQAMRAFVAPGTVATGARNRGNSTVRRLFAPELGVCVTARACVRGACSLPWATHVTPPAGRAHTGMRPCFQGTAICCRWRCSLCCCWTVPSSA